MNPTTFNNTKQTEYWTALNRCVNNIQLYFERFDTLAKEERWEEILAEGRGALQAAENASRFQDVARICAQLTSTAFYQGDYGLAIKYADRCLELSEKCEDSSLLVRALYLKSAMHRATAGKESDDVSQQKSFLLAVEAAEKAFGAYLKSEISNENLKGKVHFNWGAAHADNPKGNLEIAIDHYVKALECFKKVDASNDIIRTNLRLGKVYLLNKKYDLCRKILDESRVQIINEREAMHADYLEAQLEFALNHFQDALRIVNRGLLRARHLRAREDEARFNDLLKAIPKT